MVKSCSLQVQTSHYKISKSWGCNVQHSDIVVHTFIYLFLAALGLRCCAQAFSSCGERGLLFVTVHGLLIVVAPLVAEHRL